jgi:hypothetical protein
LVIFVVLTFASLTGFPNFHTVRKFFFSGDFEELMSTLSGWMTFGITVAGLIFSMLFAIVGLTCIGK